MFLDRELKSIQEDKKRLAICSDLRRGLVHIEVQGIRAGASRTLSNLSLGITVAGKIFGLLREYRGNRR